MPEKDWITESGLRAAVLVHPSLGHRCGYVGVPKESPLFGMDYSDDTLSDVEVHGGLTFAGNSKDYPVESDLWWFGYDCAHWGDHVPGLDATDGTQRDLPYCEHQCEELARQLAELAVSRDDDRANDPAEIAAAREHHHDCRENR